MRQGDVAAALWAYYDHGDLMPWARILDAGHTDEVQITVGVSATTIRVRENMALQQLAQRLRDLFATTSMTQLQLAEEADTGLSAVTRTLNGRVLSSWHLIRALIQVMGGDPRDYRHDWEAAKAERSQLVRAASQDTQARRTR